MFIVDNLGRSNDMLARGVEGEIIPVNETIVLTADAAEYGGARTIQQVRTNHKVTTKDRVGLYMAKGWHGLGEVIEDGLSGEDAVRKYLPWFVERIQAFIDVDGARKPLPVWANIRSDTRDILGVVGPEYQCVQNLELGRFADALVGADAALTMETCGSLLAGRKVFLLVRVPKEIRVGRTGADVTVPYLLLANGHDGSMAMTALWTMERVCCNNSYTRALGRATTEAMEGTAFRIRHTGDVAGQLAEARKILGIAAAGVSEYEQQAQTLAATQRPIDEYFRSVFVAAYGERPMERPFELGEAWDMKLKRIVGEWKALLDSPTNTIDGIGGTMWGALNAITEWNDKARSPGVKGDRRQHLNLLGVGAGLKRKAMRLALAAV